MIASLRLQNFRSYEAAAFEFSVGVNIIVGPNASGKTNLLEAILVAARGKSYRVADTELISHGADWTRLDVVLDGSSTRVYKLQPDKSPSKTYELDGKVYKKLSLNNTLPVVLFEPNHLQLLHGSPERRRTYLDDLLEQTSTGYGAILRQYKRTLAQRNALLKSVPSAQTLFPWDVRLSTLGAQIVRARSILVDELAENLPDLYKDLSHTDTQVTLKYASEYEPDAYESNLLKRLEESRERDILRGFTAHGPHRDDLSVTYDEHPASTSASRGEVRTLVLALKILELTTIEQVRGVTPLLLLDDVFSELDGARRHALTTHLAKYQSFITTTDADIALAGFDQNVCTVIPISKV